MASIKIGVFHDLPHDGQRRIVDFLIENLSVAGVAKTLATLELSEAQLARWRSRRVHRAIHRFLTIGFLTIVC